MKSQVYVRVFWFVLVMYLLFIEFYFRLSPVQQGSFIVLREWLQHGNARILLTVVWIITAVAFVALAADHLRNIYISFTGKPDNYIFLGDRLREGMYVVKENDPSKTPIFAESFINKNQYPAASFNFIYERKVLLQDKEGNLTPVEMFYTGRLILFSIIQLVLLLFSTMCVISVADQYLGGFSGGDSIQDMARATTLPGIYTALFFSILVAVYAGGVALMKYNLGPVVRSCGKIIPLPAIVHDGAVLSGRVIAAEDFEIDNTKRSVHEARFYRRYAVKFDGPDFKYPVTLNWWHQRIHQGNINVSMRKLKKERIADKAYYDRVFKHLDNAMKSGSSVQFRIGEELEIIPVFEAGN